VVRLQGVLTAAEQQLANSLPAGNGRNLLKQVRTQLMETARPILEPMVQKAAGEQVQVLNLMDALKKSSPKRRANRSRKPGHPRNWPAVALPRTSGRPHESTTSFKGRPQAIVGRSSTQHGSFTTITLSARFLPSVSWRTDKLKAFFICS
jgi:Na+-translocating membrane potential-generating system (MpsC)